MTPELAWTVIAISWGGALIWTVIARRALMELRAERAARKRQRSPDPFIRQRNRRAALIFVLWFMVAGYAIESLVLVGFVSVDVGRFIATAVWMLLLVTGAALVREYR